jgi:DNA-binding IclR family transcriptional regulator
MQLGYSKSTTHGLVHALIREGALVEHPESRKLFIGSTIYDLGFNDWNYLRMSDSAQRMINKIRDQVKETVFLGALIDRHILVTAVAEAEGPLKISAAPGARLPLFAGAAGKVLMAREQAIKVKQHIHEKGLPRYTPKSIVEETLYLSELEKVRANGYAVDDEEYLSGVRAVAIALDNFSGPPMAVWIVGLSNSMDQKKIRLAIDVTTATAKGLR